MTAQVEQAYGEARRIVRSSQSSFYAGMRLLPRDRRDALFAVYALARRIDDVADGELPAAAKLRELDALRAELTEIERSGDPVLVAVADAARRYPIPLQAFGDLLDGAEADVRGTPYEEFSDLERYCRCVAGSIGRLCLGVFETRDRVAAEPFADDLGVALQLANILRDLARDLEDGREYLPAADLARFGCRVVNGRLEGEAELLLAFEAERGLGRLHRGLRLLPLLDAASARCVVALTASYVRLLERVAREPERALESRVALPRWKKRLHVVRGLVRGTA
ncbi:MAG TPA: squalene/phytoene synthase family protein [Gaiellaceae bacterium]|nr:squalene/phytoene synthase family protein [Gaiellaceae bacterium]